MVSRVEQSQPPAPEPVKVVESHIPLWLWLLMGALLTAILFLSLMWWIMRKAGVSSTVDNSSPTVVSNPRNPGREQQEEDPEVPNRPATEQGLPFLEGGVQSREDLDRVATAFAQRSMSGAFPLRNFKVLSRIQGRGSGPLKVRYRGDRQPRDRNLNNEPCWQVLVSTPEGDRQVYILSGCGNEGVYESESGFVFIPDAESDQPEWAREPEADDSDAVEETVEEESEQDEGTEVESNPSVDKDDFQAFPEMDEPRERFFNFHLASGRKDHYVRFQGVSKLEFREDDEGVITIRFK